MKKIGIALGGGGAKGLAHLSMLQVLDELAIKPHMVSGTSIGAILGALYASGRSASEIREGIAGLTAAPHSIKEAVQTRAVFGWLDFIGLDVGRGSLLKVDKFLAELDLRIGVTRFEELAIPLKVVAADFWAREQVVFDGGPIVPAVAASFALPGIFKPVVLEGRVLVDGGCVNPLPYDLLWNECDIVIAVDVAGQRGPKDDLLPSYSESIFNTFQIAEKAILSEKMKARAPTIYVEPQISDVLVLEFHKANSIYEQAEPARKRLRQELQSMLG